MKIKAIMTIIIRDILTIIYHNDSDNDNDNRIDKAIDNY